MSMLEAVEAALAADQVADQDQATAELARLYARTIDAEKDAITVRDIGPKLLSALESLQLSPRARALARVHALNDKGNTDAAAATGLDQLRARRARKRNPAPLDSPAERPV